LLSLRQGEKLGVPIYEKRLSRKNGVPYKLAIKKMTNGLLSKSSSTMGRRWILGLWHPYIYA
jgi:hypothetical protein